MFTDVDNQTESDLPPPYTNDGHISETSQTVPKVEASFSKPSAPEIATDQLIHEPTQPNIVYVGLPMRLGDNSVRVMCPNCQANVLTDVKHESGLLTWLIAGGLCFLGLGCGCCLIPFCFDCKF